MPSHLQHVFSKLVLSIFLVLTTAQMSTAQEPPATGSVPIDALIQAIEDPETRTRFIEALRGTEAAPISDQVDSSAPTLAARAAEFSQSVLSDFTAGVLRVVGDLQRFALLPELLTPERRDVIAQSALPLLLTIFVTFGAYRIARYFSSRLRFGVWNETSSALLQTGAFLAQAGLRVGSVLVAWVIGYASAALFSDVGAAALSQAIYLNAFLIYGLFTAALSVFASDDPRDMSFAKMAPKTERVIHRSVRRMFGFLIYGLVAVAPITQLWVNFVAARSVRTLVITVGALAAFYAIARIRRALDAEAAQAAGSAGDETSVDPLRKRSAWRAIWPWLANLYVLVSYGVALVNPNQMVELVGGATIMTALSLALLLIALRAFSNVPTPPKLRLPAGLNRLLPPLEERLSGFVPITLFGFGCLLVLAAAVSLIAGWRVIDLQYWLEGSGGAILSSLTLAIAGIAFLAVTWSVLTAWIDVRLSEELSGKQVSSRSRTLLALFKNVVSIALVIFGGMTVLSELGVDIAPLLAGAGVLGLAIGFGAQKLVQDIITGIFIQLENAINEGDVVTVAGLTGSVEKLTIRSVGLRDVAGTYHLIPFSSVDTVGNFMRRFAYHVEVVGVDYASDLEIVKTAMHSAFDRLKEGPLGREIIAPLEWHGVVGLSDSSVNLRARIKTRPGQQWAVGRAYTEQVKYALDEAGVSIPFPHRELKLPQELIERLAPRPIGSS